MKATLAGLLSIGLAGTLASAGLFAYLSDTETSEGNTFAAGAVDIAVTAEHGQEFVGQDGLQLEFDLLDQGTIEIAVENVGESPATVWQRIVTVMGHDNGVNEPECETCGGTWSDTTGECEDYAPILPTVADFGFGLTVDDVELIPAEPEVSLVDVVRKYILIGELRPGDSLIVVQSLWLLDTAAPRNELQSDVLALGTEFVAYPLPGNLRLPADDIYVR